MSTDTRALFDLRLTQCAQALTRGGIGALGPMFDLVAGRLLRFARLFTRHEQDAEDVLQSVLMRTALHPEGLAGATYPWAYLIRTVRNEALRVMNRRGAATTAWDAYTANDFGDGVGDWPALALEREETQAAIRAAIESLPAEQSEVLVLKLWEGLTFAEIATVCDVSPNTAASRYRYALEKLAPRLAELVEAETPAGITATGPEPVRRSGVVRSNHD